MIFKWKKIAVSPEAPNGWEEYHTEAALGDVVVTGKVFRDSESTLQWRGVVSDSDGSRCNMGYLSEYFGESTEKVENVIEDRLISMNHGWIEYKKCRPVESGYYLVFTAQKSVFIEYYDADLGGWSEYSDDGITYWQPLPENPRG